MRAPKRVIAQTKELTEELKTERDAVAKLYEMFSEKQSPEYTAAAKKFNNSLEIAGLALLKVVEV
jgi:hypothetical protein